MKMQSTLKITEIVRCGQNSEQPVLSGSNPNFFFCFLLVFNQTLEPVACSIKVMVSAHIYLHSMLTIMIICREIDTSLSDVYGHVL